MLRVQCAASILTLTMSAPPAMMASKPGVGSVPAGGQCITFSRWREYYLAGALSPSPLMHLLKVEGGAAE